MKLEKKNAIYINSKLLKYGKNRKTKTYRIY